MQSPYLLIFSSLILLNACSHGVGDESLENSETAIGDRPILLAELLPDSDLKQRLSECALSNVRPSTLSISHRGAPLEFPEHTRQGYVAAAQQGAGLLECDVTFTKDRELVCRHSQCDLHTTTNILDTELAAQCSNPPDFSSDTPFSNVLCCTSDITLDQFHTLKGKRDGANGNAATIEEYLAGTPDWTGNVDSDYGELLSHKESIALFKTLNVSMVPELKAPQVPMPFQGDYTQSIYASQMINDYVEAAVEPSRVFPQSFNLDDVNYWIQSEPDYGQQTVYLDGRYRDSGFNNSDAGTWFPSMDELVANGVRYLASPTWMLLALDSSGEIATSQYAVAAKSAGLNLIAWTIERGGPIGTGDNWYYQTIQPAITGEGDVLRVVDVLVQEVGVTGIFSDWPATTTYYAHCTK